MHVLQALRVDCAVAGKHRGTARRHLWLTEPLVANSLLTVRVFPDVVGSRSELRAGGSIWWRRPDRPETPADRRARRMPRQVSVFWLVYGKPQRTGVDLANTNMRGDSTAFPRRDPYCGPRAAPQARSIAGHALPPLFHVREPSRNHTAAARGLERGTFATGRAPSRRPKTSCSSGAHAWSTIRPIKTAG
jgi:hypothetical protein